MNTPSRSNLFLEEDDRDLSPLNNTRKDSLMDVLASRKGSGTKDAKSQKKKRSEK